MPDRKELFEGFTVYEIPLVSNKSKNPYTRQPGCYLIKHIRSGKCYVGSSGDLAARSSKNRSALDCNRHKNNPLQELYNESSEIEFYVKSTTTAIEAQAIEQAVVDVYHGTGLLLNSATIDVVITAKGRVLTNDHKRKLLESNRTRVITAETRQRMSDAGQGRVLGDGLKAKLSSVHLSRLSTPEGKAAHAAGIAKLMKPIVIDGVRYESKSEAARQLGLGASTINHRLASSNFKNYFEVESD